MENMKHRSSSSSFTETLFGSKDGFFLRPFRLCFRPLFHGTPSCFQGQGHTGSSNKQDYESPKHSRTDGKTQRMRCENGSNSIYQTEKAEASYYCSSIFNGGQEVYPPTSNNNCSHRAFQRSGGDEDPNGSSASRGNWWQGSLYY